jgi:hypothetical protein
MKLINAWAPLLAVAAGTTLAAAIASRERAKRTAQLRAEKKDIKAWEDEGGSLAPSRGPSSG